jgi:hypothetical protein
VLGLRFRATKERAHPSAILRAPDEEARRREFEVFVADLARVRAALDRTSPRPAR